jgi:BirA family biotin operon repressor/biotin-[acetyl-CoA-carboxylase] ligase
LSKIKVDKLQYGLRTKHFGRKILFSHQVGSTNEWAKELALLGAEEGTVAIAKTQTAGHGRLGREWASPDGGLWFSVIFRPELEPVEASKLVFAIGLAVAEVLHELYGLHVETKWPNDVLVNKKKVCGILAEMNTTGSKVNFVVGGVGINANFDVNEELPKELFKNATSLKNTLGRDIQLDTLFRTVIERLECIYELFVNEGFAPVLTMWKKYASFLGCKVEVSTGTEKLVGLALDVDNDGGLTIELDDGKTKHTLVGDVSLKQK